MLIAPPMAKCILIADSVQFQNRLGRSGQTPAAGHRPKVGRAGWPGAPGASGHSLRCGLWHPARQAFRSLCPSAAIITRLLQITPTEAALSTPKYLPLVKRCPMGRFSDTRASSARSRGSREPDAARRDDAPEAASDHPVIGSFLAIGIKRGLETGVDSKPVIWIDVWPEHLPTLYQDRKTTWTGLSFTPGSTTNGRN